MQILRKLAVLVTAIGLATPVLASSPPSQGALRFDVIRKGKDIGELSYSFSGSAAKYSVQVVTDIAVKIPLIRVNAYAFKQNSVETWANGKMTSIRSATDDDGDAHQISEKGRGLLPASLWNDDILKRRQLLNTIDGTVMSVRVIDLGVQNVPTRNGQLRAHHYRISGDLERDVWYDQNGDLAHVSFKADDGSTVTYLRK
ncbi:DUF6134 family protein [Phaeobacter gallaeciensis]|uniref:DUF6134 family protein n=1 Tax=Phaeobacter gallaeciensis TaxID=60890 RepID=UPI00237F05C2|nr:DUF6134 family protein [Phaeobacter gallaeciensis]MDE4303030.1 DUF6134 family protein [Phaeobacter gallaeciensis]MDE4307422.1 DUF6134 family protein [Phaeobacter gallaeciensis]MDE4311880.1 DUF6134 family protein [Phaeobacter gallaeciensis]MDE4316615.1 DUF6134 family protein [Phaeobacter gallaeciensis]MDE4320814.1 DUF6134 family protein [Phaeobacter gallaeciensis]